MQKRELEIQFNTLGEHLRTAGTLGSLKKKSLHFSKISRHILVLTSMKVLLILYFPRISSSFFPSFSFAVSSLLPLQAHPHLQVPVCVYLYARARVSPQLL